MKRADWSSGIRSLVNRSLRKRRGKTLKSVGICRRPRFESLEDRRLLAITVNTPLDELDGSITDGDVSLRDALALASAGETINFHPSLNGGAILLALGELQINSQFTVDATMLADGLTVDAGGQSSVFYITATTTLKGLTITGGSGSRNTIPVDGGGGIFVYGGDLTIEKCVITGNQSTTGGGIAAAGNVSLINSTISNNSAQGYSGLNVTGNLNIVDSIVSGNVSTGGFAAVHFRSGAGTILRTTIRDNTGTGVSAINGPFAGATLSIAQSTIANNSTTRPGGGVYGSDVRIDLTDCIVTGNSAVGNGGGIFAGQRLSSVTVRNSVVANNSTGGSGGGIYSRAELTVINSTVSNNRADGTGGGLVGGDPTYRSRVRISHSTVTNNVSDSDQDGTGPVGGLFANIDPEIDHSIISGNIDNTGFEHDVAAGFSSIVQLRYSILGRDNPQQGYPPTNLGGSIIGTNENPVDPMLGPLAYNGGPTLTHALLPGSVAINAGDPAAVAGAGGVPLYDQRGPGFARVVGGRIDIGALESAPGPSDPVFTSPNTAIVFENSTTVLTLTATDSDLPPQTITFSIIGGADAAKFELVSGNTLVFVAPPDYESPTDANADNVYVVTVQADDGHGGSTAQTIQVAVAPVNDFAPVFTSPDVVTVLQNSTFALQVTATDADLPPQMIGFSIVGGADQAKFTITSTGALSFVTPPQFDAPTDADGDNVYVVTVRASDNAGLSAMQTVSVTVIAFNQDLGDAPDGSAGTGQGNYNTTIGDNGPRHEIVAGLMLGNRVDVDNGAQQDASARADDVGGPLPNDEDGLSNPTVDLAMTTGSQPTVRVKATNMTGSPATLYAWIDYNRNGVFEDSERAGAAVPNGLVGGVVTVTFPVVPASAVGTTYARFRLSTNVAAANPTGLAPNGEVEDYRVEIVKPSIGIANSAKTVKVAHNTNGGPQLGDGDTFGSATASIGDLDGDGVTDLAVGAQSTAYGGNPGAVYILFMNEDGTVKARQKIASGVAGGPTLANGDFFGRSIAPLGDLNGDGVTDLAVGADRDDANRGAVHILFMNPDGTAQGNKKIASGIGGGPVLTNGVAFGNAVTSLGDLDGDGIADLAAAAAGDDTGGADRGAVYVLLMNSDGTVKASQKIASGVGGGPVVADGDLFGSSLAGLGDLDGDGVTDLAVGAFGDDTGGSGRGAVHILFMNANGTVKTTQKIASGIGGGPTLANSDFFGSSAAALGDLDGDGVMDLGVGARYDDTGGLNRGALHVLFMNANGTVKTAQKIAHNTGGGPNVADDDLFGRSFAAMGDLDGDGLIDLAVGTERDDTGGMNRGAVYVLNLKSTIIPGDFDFDDVVESSDLSLWAASFGTVGGPSPTTGDADNDHDVDGGDFLIWQQNLGTAAPSVVNATAAPVAASLMSTAGEPVTFQSSLATQAADLAAALVTSSSGIASGRRPHPISAFTPPVVSEGSVIRIIGMGSRTRESTPLDCEAFSGRFANQQPPLNGAGHLYDGIVDHRLRRVDASSRATEEERDVVKATDVALRDLFAS